MRGRNPFRISAATAAPSSTCARGRAAIETDYLNGEIVLLGLEHDVPTPANRALQLLAKAALREGRAVGETALDEVLALERALA